jgi:hypothetical protein
MESLVKLFSNHASLNGSELAKLVKDTRHSRLLIMALGLTLFEPAAKA